MGTSPMFGFCVVLLCERNLFAAECGTLYGGCSEIKKAIYRTVLLRLCVGTMEHAILLLLAKRLKFADANPSSKACWSRFQDMGFIFLISSNNNSAVCKGLPAYVLSARSLVSMPVRTGGRGVSYLQAVFLRDLARIDSNKISRMPHKGLRGVRLRINIQRNTIVKVSIYPVSQNVRHIICHMSLEREPNVSFLFFKIGTKSI